MRAIIVAGGLGSRMGGAAAPVPKVMLPVGGKPLLEHQLLWFKQAGYAEVTLCLGHKAEAISEYFGDGKRWGLRLRYAVEAAPRGTAGCVADLQLKEDALIVYGDLFIDMNLKPFIDFHAERQDTAAALVLFKTDHPLDSDLADLDGQLIKRIYRARPPRPYGNLALAAVWAVRRTLLERVPADRPADFGRDILPQALADGLKLAGYVLSENETVFDLGTPERREKFLRGYAGK